MNQAQTKRRAGLAKACAVAAAKRRERTASHGGFAEVCFRMPADEYRLIQVAAERDHRSASNFMWHHAVIAAAKKDA